LWIPPGLRVDWNETQSLEILNPFDGDSAIVASIEQNQGVPISITGDWLPDEPNAAAVLESWQALRELKGREFDLFILSDHGFRNCVLSSLKFEIPRDGQLGMIRFDAEIFCPESGPTTEIQLDFTNYDSEYPYAAQVGRPSGDAQSGGSVVSGQPNQQIFAVNFPGIQDETTANGQEFRIAIGGETGKTWMVYGVQIVGAEPLGASGTSAVRVSVGSVSAGGGYVEATISQSAHFGSRAAGTLEVVSGATLYCFVSTAGGHSNLQVSILLKQVNA
jgi:hypothetical protein